MMSNPSYSQQSPTAQYTVNLVSNHDCSQPVQVDGTMRSSPSENSTETRNSGIYDATEGAGPSQNTATAVILSMGSLIVRILGMACEAEEVQNYDKDADPTNALPVEFSVTPRVASGTAIRKYEGNPLTTGNRSSQRGHAPCSLQTPNERKLYWLSRRLPLASRLLI
ncbi:hypothetical protein CSKR_114172 [Clonorchis sinensis]|uniref:Uncharacterized protein n=1 Tax=Clonorchis sinensis TaxID=79923 RepID=A0A3R7FZG4_CLOSI|nr:hypothetical protein CSKR_114172 [Clonorchis sinensis]